MTKFTRMTYGSCIFELAIEVPGADLVGDQLL